MHLASGSAEAESTNEVLLPGHCEVHVVSYKDHHYLVDPNRPNVIRVEEPVARVFTEYRERPVSDILAALPNGEHVVREVKALRAKGFFTSTYVPQPSTLVSARTFALEVTNACNMGCAYCYSSTQSPSDPSARQMSPETARAAVDFFANSSQAQLEIAFFGGEPLANFKSIREVVHYCGDAYPERFHYSVTTNATLVTDEISEFLERHRFRVLVSLEGSPAIQNELRPMRDGRPSIEKVRAGFRRLRDRRLPLLSTNTVVTNQTSRVHETVDFLLEEGARNISTTSVESGTCPALQFEAGTAGALMDQESAILEGILSGEYPDDFRYLPMVQYLRAMASSRFRDFRCGAGREYWAVDTAGNLYVCHRHLAHPERRVGHVASGVREGVHEHQATLNFCHGRDCGRCWARRLCGGPCVAESLERAADEHATIAAKCDHIRHLAHLSVILFGELFHVDRPRLARMVRGDQAMDC